MSTPNASANDDPSLGISGWHVSRVAETGSTNADLLAAAASGAPHRSVLVTDHQTAGRGRLDRKWDAPPGQNLLVSVLFRTGFDPTTSHSLTQLAAVAAARTAEQLVGITPELKWPNDLLLNGCKLAGILAQSATTGSDRYVVVGMGLNLGWAPDGAAKLDSVTPHAFLPVWLAEIARLMEIDCFDEYRHRLSTLGQMVRVELASGPIEGYAVDVQRDGSLLVRTALEEITVLTGDVIHLRGR